MADATTWTGSGRNLDSVCVGRSQAPAQKELKAESMGRLLRTIEGEIIPRLVLALQTAPEPAVLKGKAHSGAEEDDVTEFARLVAAHDVSVATAYLNALLHRGIALETIYLELLAPAARLLGEWWKQDLKDFTEVTSGLCRMHQLLHEFSPTFLHDAPPAAPDRCVLLVPMPGEQHSFGLIMVAEFFRRAGWDVWDLHPSTSGDLMGVVRKQWFSVIGVSLSCQSRIEELKPLIEAARESSRNKSVCVMVGGQPFIGHPEQVAAVGADATASDGRRAALEANRLLTSIGRRV
jgi:MerR family transcriptional regulator, light-induced transcriptional regulator